MFDEQAIGMYLQIENQMSPVLQQARKDYASYVSDLEKLNKKAFKTSSKMLTSIGELTDSFNALPKQAVMAYDKARRALSDRIKPLKQPINLEFKPSALKTLNVAIANAVANALKKVRLRLGPTIPQKRNSLFKTGESLRASYKREVQPTDFFGRFTNIPKFAKGGPVDGPAGTDKVLAYLTKGEFVLNDAQQKSITDAFTSLTTGLGRLKLDGESRFMNPKDFKESIGAVLQLKEAADGFRKEWESTGKKSFLLQHRMALSGIRSEMLKLEKSATLFNPKSMSKLLPIIGKLKQTVGMMATKTVTAPPVTPVATPAPAIVQTTPVVAPAAVSTVSTTPTVNVVAPPKPVMPTAAPVVAPPTPKPTSPTVNTVVAPPKPVTPTVTPIVAPPKPTMPVAPTHATTPVTAPKPTLPTASDVGATRMGAYVTPVEFTVSKDQRKNIEDSLHKIMSDVGPLKVTGQTSFMNQKDLRASIAGILHMQEAAKQFKEAWEITGNKSFFDLHQKSLHGITKEMEALETTAKSLTPKSLMKFSPVLKHLRDATGEVSGKLEDMEAASTKLGRLFQKLLGPAKFLAAQKALQSLQAGFHSVTRAGEDVANQIGANKDVVEDYATELGQANQYLNLTRSELFGTGLAAIDSAKQMGLGSVGPARMADALNDLARAGVRDKQTLLELSPVVASFQKITGTDVSDTLYTLRDNLHMTTKDATAVVVEMQQVAKTANISFDQLHSSFTETMDAGMKSALMTMSPDAQKKIISDTTKLSAALSSSFMSGMDLSKKLGEAMLDPASEAATQLAMIVGKPLDFSKMRATGNLSSLVDGLTNSPAIKALQDQLAQGNSSGALMTASKLAPLLGTTAEALVKAASSGKTFGESWKGVADISVSIADAMGTLQGALKNSSSGWEAFTNKVKSFIVSNVPIDVIEFFDNVSLQAVHSAVYLGRELVGSLVSVTGGMIGMVKSGGEAVGILNKTATAASSVASVGTSAAGASAGLGIGGFLTGLAQGLGAFAAPQTILGTAVVTGAVVVAIGGIALAIGGALRIAGPEVMTAFMNGILGIAKAFFELDAGRMLAAGAAMGMFGVGIGLFASGLFAASTTLLAAAPVLLLLGGIMFVAQKTGLTGGLIGVLDDLIAGFASIDAGKAAKAALSVAASTLFIGALGAAGVVLGAVAVGGLALAIPALLGVLVLKGVAAVGPAISDTINGLADAFSGIDGKKAQAAAMGAVWGGTLLAGVALGAVAVSAIGAGALALLPFFVAGAIALGVVTAAAPQIVSTINGLAEEFVKLKADPLKTASLNTVYAGMFIAAIGVGLGAVALTGGVVLAGIAAGGALLVGILGMAALALVADKVVATINSLAVSFSKLETSQMDQAATNMALSANFVGQIMGMTTVVGVASLGSVVAMLMGVPALMVVAASAPSIVDTLNSLVTSFSGLKTDGIPMVLEAFTSVADMMSGYKVVMDKIGATTPGFFDTAFDSLAGLFGGDKLSRFSANLASNMEAVKQLMATSGEIRSVVLGQMQHELSVQIPTPKQIEQVVTVQIAGSVVAQDSRTHELLTLIAELLSKKQDVPQAAPEARSGNRSRVASDDTVYLSGG